MYKVDVIISKNDIYPKEKLANLFDDNVLRLSFKTEQQYLAFMNNPQLSIENFNIIPGLSSEEDINKLLENIDLPKALKDTRPMIEILDIKDLPIKLLERKEKLALNLSNLNFEDSYSIITHPLISENVTFYRKYDEGRETTLKEMIDVYNELLSLAKTAIDNNYSPAESIFYIYNIAKKKNI